MEHGHGPLSQLELLLGTHSPHPQIGPPDEQYHAFGWYPPGQVYAQGRLDGWLHAVQLARSQQAGAMSLSQAAAAGFVDVARAASVLTMVMPPAMSQRIAPRRGAGSSSGATNGGWVDAVAVISIIRLLCDQVLGMSCGLRRVRVDSSSV